MSNNLNLKVMQDNVTKTANILEKEQLTRREKQALLDRCTGSFGIHAPQVYVGTYRKYNNGDIYGQWIDLQACEDYATFMEVCRFLHEDEMDPEFMYQDYQYFPEQWYSESCMDEEMFNKIVEYANLTEDEREVFQAYMDATGDDDIEAAQDKYMGKYDSEGDFARMIVNECYNLDDMGPIAYYFDYERYARDLFRFDYIFQDGHVFQY